MQLQSLLCITCAAVAKKANQLSDYDDKRQKLMAWVEKGEVVTKLEKVYIEIDVEVSGFYEMNSIMYNVMLIHVVLCHFILQPAKNIFHRRIEEKVTNFIGVVKARTLSRTLSPQTFKAGILKAFHKNEQVCSFTLFCRGGSFHQRDGE